MSTVLDSQATVVDAPVVSSPEPRPRRFPANLLVAAAVILTAAGFLVVTAMQNSAVYYLTVSELRAAAIYDQPVRVAGNVVVGSIQRDPTTLVVTFETEDASGRMPVTYRGVLPDIFGDGVEVVVEGKYSADGHFAAGTLLAKCPSKFEA